ncbi:hypothetical protein HDV02_005276 [Globomyces sp. JEL0801]|nr:hypothetical protein HDV02_005276 [Globomyces sp. JEL0801]
MEDIWETRLNQIRRKVENYKKMHQRNHELSPKETVPIDLNKTLGYMQSMALQSLQLQQAVMQNAYRAMEVSKNKKGKKSVMTIIQTDIATMISEDSAFKVAYSELLALGSEGVDFLIKDKLSLFNKKPSKIQTTSYAKALTGIAEAITKKIESQFKRALQFSTQSSEEANAWNDHACKLMFKNVEGVMKDIGDNLFEWATKFVTDLTPTKDDNPTAPIPEQNPQAPLSNDAPIGNENESTPVQ